MNLNEKQAIQILQKEMNVSPNIYEKNGPSDSDEEMNVLDQTF